MKKALITGINGQDGSYLAEFLLEKGYDVHGIVKRNSIPENQTARIQSIWSTIQYNLYHADMCDMSSLLNVINKVQPDEIYNLAAQSHVGISFEMFGNSIDEDGFQREETPMNPASPYACSKLLSYNLINCYRESYDIFASNGILFNHESPRRGINFITNKVAIGAAKIKKGLAKELVIGNLDSTRDWGHAKDYVKRWYTTGWINYER